MLYTVWKKSGNWMEIGLQLYTTFQVYQPVRALQHIHTFIHWWQRLQYKVPACLSVAIQCFLFKESHDISFLKTFTLTAKQFVFQHISAPRTLQYQEHFPWNGGAADQTTDHLISGWPALPPDNLATLDAWTAPMWGVTHCFSFRHQC